MSSLYSGVRKYIYNSATIFTKMTTTAEKFLFSWLVKTTNVGYSLILIIWMSPFLVLGFPEVRLHFNCILHELVSE